MLSRSGCLYSLPNDLRGLADALLVGMGIHRPSDCGLSYPPDSPGSWSGHFSHGDRFGEWIALRLCELVYVNTNIRKWDYLSRAVEPMGIKIEKREGIYKITLPGLRPKRKSRKGTAYRIKPLYAVVERFIREHRSFILRFLGRPIIL